MCKLSVNMKSIFKQTSFIYIFLFFFHFALFSQNKDNLQLENLSGIWENHNRFIEITKSTENGQFGIKLRFVLKPYYQYVHEKNSIFFAEIEQKENSNSCFYFYINYPFFKKKMILPVCSEEGFLFTSFYEKTVYETDNLPLPEDLKPAGLTGSQEDYALNRHTSPLYGFWVEQGFHRGILLYPQEAPKSIDAYFFTDSEYIRFRYWVDDLAYDNKKVYFNDKDGNSYKVPKLLQRNGFVYSCVTNNGSVLRNFEKGSYTITEKKKDGKNALFLTLKPSAAGPGTNAAADTYPIPYFSLTDDIPLYILDNKQIFSIGNPCLIKSDVKDLDEEIKIHNSKKRKIKNDREL